MIQDSKSGTRPPFSTSMLPGHGRLAPCGIVLRERPQDLTLCGTAHRPCTEPGIPWVYAMMEKKAPGRGLSPRAGGSLLCVGKKVD
jgi:hypothetical protein